MEDQFGSIKKYYLNKNFIQFFPYLLTLKKALDNLTHKNIIAPETINLSGIKIKSVKEISLLGFMIDLNLNFSKQACNMSLAFKFKANNFNDLNNFLEKYGLYAFQHRFLDRMSSFSFKTYFYHNSPENIKDRLIKNDSRNLSYNLRNSAKLIEPMAKTNSVPGSGPGKTGPKRMEKTVLKTGILDSPFANDYSNGWSKKENIFKNNLNY
ncbi:hypothetical protein BpHYR1_033262 [Brachionus plicatilis]|uniref:Uncharacterized protein n=1 Tax=Brachionus plicatilis TaxID=10195 RepID=A0A3M7T6W7_BRAPC|nr:hypothetical protein BpHYR1_033262 [Brachionus plicatilis]